MTLADFFSNYADVRREMLDAVKNLTQEQLDWKPANHPNSIGYLLRHIALNECFWIEVVAEQSATEADLTPFRQARTREETLAHLDATFRTTMKYLEANNVENWDEASYEFTADDGCVERFTKRWLVWHVVEHQARHRGQIFMMMRMQGLDVPDV